MKVKKLLCTLLITLSTVLGLAFSAACTKTPKVNPPKEEGPETGVYYYDSDEGEYLISLSKGDRVIFTTAKLSAVGTYSVEGGNITFTVPVTEQSGENEKTAIVPATLVEDVLTLTYEETEWRFLKKIMYSVVFDTGIPEESATVSVLNGKTVAKPADPVRQEYLFRGWYTESNYQKLYNFDSEIVRKDMTLYAQWTPVVPEQTEYEIKFDLNYPDAEPIAAMKTVGGKLYEVTTPERDGYDFGGWWISVYDDPEKLSYVYTEDMVFSENLTLYAKWLPKGTADKLASPVVTVTDTGVHWTAVKGALNYLFELAYVTDAGDEQSLVNETVPATSRAYDFASAAAGNYVIRVTARSSVSQNNSDPAVVYHLNKGLKKVSEFSVAGNALIFNAVPNAEKYLVTVDCGNKEHNHTLFDNGNSTYYNFSNCEMQNGGIKFIVTAIANGYTSSTSDPFVYDRTLDGISEFVFDDVTETLSWKAVPAAASYVVKIIYDDESVTINIGGRTQISLKQYASAEGEIKVSVYPKTKGYNSPEAAEYTYEKTALATPSDFRISGNILSWAPVAGAEKYEIRIGNHTYLTSTNEAKFDLSSVANDIKWTTAADYRLAIRAIGAQNSSWSDDIDIRYCALYSALSYSEGLLSWRHVVGAVAYEVKVNDGNVQTITDGSNRAAITFTRAGENILSVRFFDGNVWSDWAALPVKAYEISFDSRGGKGVDSVYKAIGDPVDFSESTRAGYTFGGWYNSISGASGNGALYKDEFFSETGDIILYAYWRAATFQVTYDCGEGNTIENESGEVVYNKNYQLDVPTPADGTLVFMGWYAEANGKGTQYTDGSGKSVNVWKLPYDVRMVAYWQPLLTFSKTAEGYSVVRNKKIESKLYVNITIPATYQGPDDERPLPVKIVDGAAFASCGALESIRIPNCVIIIESTAFNSCDNLKKVEIYEVDGVNEPVYSSVNGAVLYNNPRTKAVDLSYVPQGLTGDENGTYVIPEGVTNIPYRAFNKNVFSEIVVSKSVMTIEVSAFYSCPNLTKVTFATGGTDELIFRGDTFRSCSALTEVTLPARISEFNPEFFASSSALQRINIEDSETNRYSSVDGLLFNKNKNELLYCPAGRTGKYEFATSVTSVGAKAFYKCKNIQEVVFNGWMQEIGEGAFEECTALVKITFKGAENNEAVKLVIGPSAFQGCSELAEVVFEAKSRVTEIGENAFWNCKKFLEITLPASLETIGANAFAFNSTVSDSIRALLTFAKDGHLKTIGANAFSNRYIVSLSFPASLTMIGSQAFSNNSQLTSVEFADSDTKLTLGSYAFQSCWRLESITIPKNVDLIEEGVFDRCSKLASILVDEKNEKYLTADGVLFDKDFTQLLFYPAGKTGTFVLPKDVKSIGAGVFRGNTSLTSIQIGKQVTSIGNDAFRECYNLEEVIFDRDTTNTETLVFGTNVFQDCRSLTSLELPNRIEEIPDLFAESCFSLGSVTIPESVKTIGNSAFKSTALKSLTIPASVTTIGNGAFAKGGSITGYEPPALNVVFEDGDEALEVGSNLFDQSMVESVKLPERLTTISDYMFYRCYSLTQIGVPSTVTEIGYAAFTDCTNLAKATFKDSEDPARTVTVADGEYKSNDHGVDDSFYGAFCNNTSLTEVTLPKGLTRVANYMFYGCTSLERIVIPNTITNGAEDIYAVGQCAFKKCSNLRVVDFQTGGTGEITIGGSSYYRYSATGTGFRATAGAFQDCAKLETVNFPENLAGTTDVRGKKVAAISATGQIFDGCTSLTRFNVAKGTATDNYYYTTDNGLLCYKSGDENILLMCAPGAKGKIVVPNTITKISPLDEELYKSTIIRVGFNSCNYVTEIEFETGGEHDLTIDGSFYVAVSGSSCYGAFNDMGMLQKVTLPARLTTLGGCAFANCSNLTQIDFEKDSRLESIEEYAFYRTGFTTITLPDSVKMLGNYLFMNSSLQSITLPGSLEALGATFANCNTLEELTFTSSGNVNFTSVNGVVYKLVKNAAGATIGRELAYYPYGKTDVSFQIPADVVKIGDSAFKDNPYLRTLTFENSAEGLKADRSNALVIGEAAFQNCTKLTSVALPARLTTSGRIAFAECSNLKTVTFEEACELQTISEGMFWKCGSLSSITLPKKITALDNGAFASSFLLKTVTFAADGVPVELYGNAYSKSYDRVPDSSSSSYRYGVFAGCYSLETINFNNRLSGTIIPAYTFVECRRLNKLNDVIITDVAKYGFYNCLALADDTIDFSGLTTEIITTYAFYGCASLKNISLPASVTTIESNAFCECVSLQTINLEKVSYIAGSAFKNCSELIKADLSAFLGYNEKYLTILDSSTFEGCASLQDVTLPAGLTKINGSVFKNCEALVSIELPETLINIGSSAFEGCASLSTIDLSKVQYINSKAFLECNALAFVDLSSFVGSGSVGKLDTDTFRNSGLTSFTFDKSDATKTNVIPAKIKNLSYGVFAGTKLTKVTFEDDAKIAVSLSSGTSPTSTLSSHSYGVFEGCTELASVNFGERKLSISTCTFRGCTALKEIVIGKAVTSISSYAFYDCENLAAVSIPTDGALTYINANVFTNMTSLTKVEFTTSGDVPGTKFAKINDNAFQNTGISEIVIPTSVTNVGAYAFEGCQKLTSVTFAGDAENKSKLSLIGDGLSGSNQYASYSFANCPLLKTVVFPVADNVRIGDSTFMNSGIEEITLSDGVTAIGYGAFLDCWKLKTVNVDAATSKLSAMQPYAFANCGFEAMPTIPEKLEYINAYVFSGCAKMTEASIPSNVGTIYVNAFENCTLLETIEFKEGVMRIADYAFLNCTSLATIELPASLATIGKNPFAGCANLQSIDVSTNDNFTFSDDAFYVENTLVMVMPNKQGTFFVPERVTEIAPGAFAGTEISSIIIQNPDTIIGSYAFAYMKQLESMTLPANLTEIPEGAFAYSGLTSMEIPAGITTIGSYAFAYTPLTGMDIPETVTSIGSYAFYGCAELETLTFGAESYESFGEYVFANSGVSSLVLPVNVTVIHDGMFEGCSNLTSVTFKGTLTSIGAYAFKNCGLTEFIVPNTVTSIAGGAFKDSNLENIVFEEGGEALVLGDWDKATEDGSAFAGLESLKSVTLARIAVLPANLFANCTNLTTVALPASIEQIGKYAFKNTGAVKTAGAESFVIPASVAKINYGAFLGSNLKAVVFAEGDTPITLTDGTEDTTSKKITKEGIFQDTAGLRAVTWSSRVTKIAKYMFYSSGIETIDLPEGLTNIGSYAFYNTGLRMAVIPNSVTGTNCGTYVFGGCKNLETVTLSEGMKTVPIGAFMDSSLQRIVIPANITDLYSYSFSGCSKLTSVTILGETIKIGKQAFMNCKAIRELALPAGVNVGDVDVFYGWTEAQTIRVLQSGQGISWKLGWDNGCKANIIWQAE